MSQVTQLIIDHPSDSTTLVHSNPSPAASQPRTATDPITASRTVHSVVDFYRALLRRVRLRPKSITPVSPRSESVITRCGQKSLVSVVSSRFPNSITTTYCQQVDNKLATSR